MSMYENSLDELVERTCKLHLRDWLEGTATGGSTSTVVDTSRNEADDYFNNLPRAEVYIRTTTDGAAPIGETRNITGAGSDFANSSGTITIVTTPLFTGAVTAGDTYSIHTEFSRDEVVEAINAAIAKIKSRALIELIDEDTILTAAVYEYPVPAGFTHIYRITMSDGNGNFYGSCLAPHEYKIVRGKDIPRIHFFGFPVDRRYIGHYYSEPWRDIDLTADSFLRIEGFSKQAKLVNSTDICRVNPDFVCPQAAAFLQASRIYRSDVDPDEHRVQYTIQQGLANDALRVTRTQFPPDTKKVER